LDFVILFPNFFWVQGRGIADAVTYLKSEIHLHNEKIILWGDSFAGMLVLVGA
jgi:hypothetical protein